MFSLHIAFSPASPHSRLKLSVAMRDVFSRSGPITVYLIVNIYIVSTKPNQTNKVSFRRLKSASSVAKVAQLIVLEGK